METNQNAQLFNGQSNKKITIEMLSNILHHKNEIIFLKYLQTILNNQNNENK
jgi:hypothetical protein